MNRPKKASAFTAGAFYHCRKEGDEMKAEKKCKKCIWASTKNGIKLYCPFSKCFWNK